MNAPSDGEADGGFLVVDVVVAVVASAIAPAAAAREEVLHALGQGARPAVEVVADDEAEHGIHAITRRDKDDLRASYEMPCPA